MAGSRVYNHSGMGNANYSNIDAYSTFTVSGMGNVSINGVIGQSATIRKSGMGNLMVNGQVSENVRFEVSGMGNVIFARTPPNSVINLLTKSGMGRIEMPGGYNPPQASSQRNRNNVSFSNVVIGNNTFMVNNDDDYSPASPVSPASPDSPDNNYGTSNIVIGGLSIVSRDGYVNITQNGVTTSYRGNSASINNNRVLVDGRSVGPADAVINPNLNQNNRVNAQGSNSFNIMNMLGGMFPSSAASAVVLPRNPAVPNLPANNRPGCSVDPAPIPAGAQNMTDDDFISRCSKHAREYINNSQLNKRISEKIKELGDLSEDEKVLFEKFIDPITEEYMDIPVFINDFYYDISTILRWKFKDPQSREPYNPLEIQSGRRLVNELDEVIQTLKNNREARQANSQVATGSAAQAVAMDGVAAPGGPGFRR